MSPRVIHRVSQQTAEQRASWPCCVRREWAVSGRDQLCERLKHRLRHAQPRHPVPAGALVRLKQRSLLPLQMRARWRELTAGAAQHARAALTSGSSARIMIVT